MLTSSPPGCFNSQAWAQGKGWVGTVHAEGSPLRALQTFRGVVQVQAVPVGNLKPKGLAGDG